MRKKSKYKPKGVRLDTMTWLVEGMTKVTDKKSAYLTMHLKNLSALDSLTKGTANKQEMDIIQGNRQQARDGHHHRRYKRC